MKIKIQKNSGVALLISLGVLALLSIVGLAFATNMRLGQRTSLDFLRNIQVRYVAEGGIQRAIGELKYHHYMTAGYPTGNGAKYGFFDARFIDPNQEKGEYWYYGEKYGNNDQNNNGIPFEYLAGVPLEDALQVSLTSRVYDWAGNPSDIIPLGNNFTIRYDLKIIDTGSQINVNDTNNGNLEAILTNLCTYLGAPLDANDGAAIYNNRPQGGYGTKGHVKLAFDANNNKILDENEENKYNRIKDFITVKSYEDPNNNNKAPINVNTASWQVIASILRPLLNDNSEKAEAAARNMVIYDNTPIKYSSWESVKWVLENYTSLDLDERERVYKSVNSNRTFNEATDTKFSFNSGGYYDIESLATIRDSFNNVVAKKKISTVVKIYDMWNMTTKEQFRDNVAIDDNGNRLAQWVNWWDRCPIDMATSYNTTYSYDSDNTISGSLKLGYWDDFEDDEPDSDSNDEPDQTYRDSVWKKFDENADGDPKEIDYIDPRTGYTISDGKMYVFDASQNEQDWPLVTIGYDIDKGAGAADEKWYCDNFLLKAYITDNGTSSHYIPYEYLVGGSNLKRKYDAVTQVLVRAGSFNENTAVYLSISDGPSEIGHPQPSDPLYPSPDPSHENYYPEYNADPDQTFNPADPPRTPPPPSLATVRIVRGTNDQKNETPPFPFINYVGEKIFKVEGHLGGAINRIDATVYSQAGGLIGGESLPTLIEPGPTTHRGVGAIGFYGGTIPFYLDNVRVIPDTGHYESKFISDMTPSLELPPAYEWGTLWATISLSPGADWQDKEFVQLTYRTSALGDTWVSYINSKDPDFGGFHLWSQIYEADSSDIQFLAVLISNHPDDNNYEYNKIPILEDIWITYLPKTKIHYWREE